MPPRKSGASMASAQDTNGDVSMVSNATNATTSPTQHAHPKQSRQSGGASGKQDDGIGIDVRDCHSATCLMCTIVLYIGYSD
jgi:hypothetical protein